LKIWGKNAEKEAFDQEEIRDGREALHHLRETPESSA